MSLPLKIAIPVSSAVLTMLAVGWLQTSSTATEDGATRDDDATELASEVARLRFELDALRRSQQGLSPEVRTVYMPAESGEPQGEPDSVRPSPQSPMLTHEELVLKEKEQAEARMEVMDAQLDSEPEDPDWGRQAEDIIASALELPEGPSDTRMTHLSCRSTICVADFTHESVDELLAFTSRIGDKEGFSGLFFERRGLEGEVAPSSTYYFSREGHNLPKN